MTSHIDRAIIQDYTSRPGKYANVDGLLELYWGVWMLGMALLGSLARATPKPWRPAVYIGLLAWQVLLFLGLRAARRRITERRTGFVLFRNQPSTPREHFRYWALLFIISGLVSFLFLQFHATASLALGNLIAYAWMSRMDRVWKWPIFSAMATGSILLLRGGTEWHDSPLPWLILLGSLWSVSGAITFCLYWKNSKEVSA